MKRLLLLLSAHTYRAPDFMAAARKLGVDLVIGTEEELPLGTLSAGAAIQLDLRSVEAGLAAIEKLAESHPLDAVVAVDDAGQALAARASAALGIPSNPSESVVSAQNKRVFREICRSAGLVTPWFREVPLSEHPRTISQTLRFPCVIKPLHLSASRGVIRANDPAEFVTAFARVKAMLARPDVYQRAPELAETVLVEGYLEGTEAALEGLVSQGEFRPLAFFDKPDPLEGPFFQETLYVTPSRYSAGTQARAVEAVQGAVRALGLRVGPVHAEVRIHQGQATVLDLAPRSIGGHCGRTLRFGHGLTLEELILVQALGLDPGPMERERPAAGVLMIPIPRAGILRGVGGTAEARAVPGVVEVEILVPPGQWVEPPPEGDRYLGFVFARAGTPEKVEAALRRAGDALQVKIGSGAEDSVK